MCKKFDETLSFHSVLQFHLESGLWNGAKPQEERTLDLQYDQSNSNNQWILPFATFMSISERMDLGICM